jgi:predicted house-cleaning noncanonical NTP pyrophosphatase (MazG superfamily)
MYSQPKLIRDRIPEIITKAGKQADIKILSQEEYRQALRYKLMEEAQEVAEAGEADLIKELADVYEVMDAIMVTYGIDRHLVLAEQSRRRQERGGFEQQICLLRVSDGGTNPYTQNS